MRRLSSISALAFMLIGLAAACTNPVSQNPMGPAGPTVSGLQIAGPSTIAPGQSVQLTADVRLSNGAVKSSATALNIRWRSSNTAVLQVTESGLATAGPNPGDATVTAEVLPTTNPRGTREIVVVPDGTYRVVGTVRESDTPRGIPGARVEVTGTSVVATTASNGGYRLFGVPPVAELRVIANGYQPVVQNVQLNDHATYNFALGLSGPRVTLNGSFTLAIDVEGTCTGNPPLPTSLQHRTYEASVTTTGATVDVRLTEPRYVINFNQGNRFFGTSDPAGVTFALAYFYSYYYTYYPSIAERLPDNTVLVPFGTAATVSSGGGVTGLMNGSIYQYDSRYPAFNAAIVGRCSSNNIRLTLTPR